MTERVVTRTTVLGRARGPGVGEVVIYQEADTVEVRTLDGATHRAEGNKRYYINARDPVNWEDGAFVLARTGEILTLL